MKSFFLVFALTLSLPLIAQSSYVQQMKSVYGKMIKLKQDKDRMLIEASKLPAANRADAVSKAAIWYKDSMLPLMNEAQTIRDANFGKASAADEALVDAEKLKLTDIMRDRSAEDSLNKF